jgi:hypothetical protein
MNSDQCPRCGRELQPVEIAELYAQAAEFGDEVARRLWVTCIPARHYPLNATPEDLDRLAEILHVALKERFYFNPNELAPEELFTALIQDDAAEAMGMPIEDRITCGEHVAWRTIEHLADKHADAELLPAAPLCERPGNTHRPGGDPAPGDRCKDCQRPLTWIGPEPSDWALTDEEPQR